MATWQCKLVLNQTDDTVSCLWAPGSDAITSGDFVQFSSDDGMPIVELADFSQSPYESGQLMIAGNRPVQVVKLIRGLRLRCNIVTPDGQLHGWHKDRNEKSGGDQPPPH